MADSLFSTPPEPEPRSDSPLSAYSIDSIPRDVYEVSQGLFLQPSMLNDFQDNCRDLARALAQNEDDHDMSRNPPKLKRNEYGVLMIDRALGRRRKLRDKEEKSDGDATTLAERDQPVMHTEEKVALPQPRPKGSEDEITLTEIDEGAGGEHFYGQDNASTDDAHFWMRFMSRRDEHVDSNTATTITKSKESPLERMTSHLKRMWQSNRKKRQSDKKNKNGCKDSENGKPSVWKRVSREFALTENNL